MGSLFIFDCPGCKYTAEVSGGRDCDVLVGYVDRKGPIGIPEMDRDLGRCPKCDEEGAEERLAAALELKKRLEAIIEGKPPFDIFVRWKPIEKQAIGWEPDINDGARLNIRPFMAQDINGGKKGSGILRWKPNIKWDKDRGKEPQRPKDEYPWFWGWDKKTEDWTGGKEFDGNRWNACHYTDEAKRNAREAAKKGGR